MPEPARILIADDHAHGREILRDYLAILGYAAFEAVDGIEATRVIERERPDLVLLDLMMPRMDGFAVLEWMKERGFVREIPVVVISLLDEMEGVVRCIELGAEDFLHRPIKTELLAARLKNALEKKRLAREVKDLLELTLRESIKAMTEVLALSNPTAFTRATRLARLARLLCEELRLSDPTTIEIAALLSHLGLTAVPESTIQKSVTSAPLSAQEALMFERYPMIGADLIGKIPRLEEAAEIVRYHRQRFDGGGAPDDGRKGRNLPLGARMLRVLYDYDSASLGGAPPGAALDELRAQRGVYDPEMLEALGRALTRGEKREVLLVPAAGLAPGMILDQDLKTSSGLLLVARGFEVSHSLCDRLRNFISIGDGLCEPIRVSVSAGRGATTARRAAAETACDRAA